MHASFDYVRLLPHSAQNDNNMDAMEYTLTIFSDYI